MEPFLLLRLKTNLGNIFRNRNMNLQQIRKWGKLVESNFNKSGADQGFYGRGWRDQAWLYVFEKRKKMRIKFIM